MENFVNETHTAGGRFFFIYDTWAFFFGRPPYGFLGQIHTVNGLRIYIFVFFLFLKTLFLNLCFVLIFGQLMSPDIFYVKII